MPDSTYKGNKVATNFDDLLFVDTNPNNVGNEDGVPVSSTTGALPTEAEKKAFAGTYNAELPYRRWTELPKEYQVPTNTGGFDPFTQGLQISLPPMPGGMPAGQGGPTVVGGCYSDCALLAQKQRENCAAVRKRVQYWLNQNSCPSIVKASGHKKKSTAKASSSKTAAATTVTTRRGR